MGSLWQRRGPSRTTQKSTRPRASDRSMCCPPGNHSACQLRKPIDVVATKLKMQLRWNHARPAAGPEGRKPKRNRSHNEQGLEVKDALSPSGRGRKMSLTSPLQKLFKRESPRPGVQVWRLFFGVIGFVVGGIFPHSTQSLCPRMFGRTSACDRQVGRVDEP